MWMPAQTTMPPGASTLSACGTSAPAEAKMIAASSCSGGGSSLPPAQVGAERAGELLRALVARAGEREHLAALEHRDLADHVRGGPEAVEAEAARVAGEPQRAVADQPAAQQRRRLLVGSVVGEGEAEALVGDGQLGEAAVDVAAGEARVARTGSRARSGSSGSRRRSSRATARRRGGRRRCGRRSGGRARPAASVPRSRCRAGGGRCGTPRTRLTSSSSWPGAGLGVRAASPARAAGRVARAGSRASLR